MPLIILFSLCLIALFLPGWVTPTSVEGRYYTSTQHQNITFELARRLPELGDDVTKPYKKGDRIFFRLIMTNNSSESKIIKLTNPYYQNRPELLREGEKVSYRKNVAEDVELVDKEIEFSKVSAIELKPYEPVYVDVLDLKDWYDVLLPGDYQLTNRFRFDVGGGWAESNSISFTIEPK